MFEELVHLDKELFLYLNNLGNTSWDGFWMFITGKINWIPLYLVLLFLAFKNFGKKRTLVLLVAVGLMILCTDQLSNFFKYGVQRLRPCYDPELSGLMRLVKTSCGGKFGYFSGHAINSFAVAFFFSYLMGRKWKLLSIFLMVWAFMVAYSRIYIGVHFPLDVISGSLVGIVLGWLFAKLYIFAIHKYHV
ncbi:MAG: phosphatase PAP2 family protein [Flavobacteriaceae bacterium]